MVSRPRVDNPNVGKNFKPAPNRSNSPSGGSSNTGSGGGSSGGSSRPRLDNRNVGKDFQAATPRETPRGDTTFSPGTPGAPVGSTINRGQTAATVRAASGNRPTGLAPDTTPQNQAQGREGLQTGVYRGNKGEQVIVRQGPRAQTAGELVRDLRNRQFEPTRLQNAPQLRDKVVGIRSGDTVDLGPDRVIIENNNGTKTVINKVRLQSNENDTRTVGSNSRGTADLDRTSTVDMVVDQEGSGKNRFSQFSEAEKRLGQISKESLNPAFIPIEGAVRLGETLNPIGKFLSSTGRQIETLNETPLKFTPLNPSGLRFFGGAVENIGTNLQEKPIRVVGTGLIVGGTFGALTKGAGIAATALNVPQGVQTAAAVTTGTVFTGLFAVDVGTRVLKADSIEARGSIVGEEAINLATFSKGFQGGRSIVSGVDSSVRSALATRRLQGLVVSQKEVRDVVPTTRALSVFLTGRELQGEVIVSGTKPLGRALMTETTGRRIFGEQVTVSNTELPKGFLGTSFRQKTTLTTPEAGAEGGRSLSPLTGSMVSEKSINRRIFTPEELSKPFPLEGLTVQEFGQNLAPRGIRSASLDVTFRMFEPVGETGTAIITTGKARTFTPSAQSVGFTQGKIGSSVKIPKEIELTVENLFSAIDPVTGKFVRVDKTAPRRFVLGTKEMPGRLQVGKGQLPVVKDGERSLGPFLVEKVKVVETPKANTPGSTPAGIPENINGGSQELLSGNTILIQQSAPQDTIQEPVTETVQETTSIIKGKQANLSITEAATKGGRFQRGTITLQKGSNKIEVNNALLTGGRFKRKVKSAFTIGQDQDQQTIPQDTDQSFFTDTQNDVSLSASGTRSSQSAAQAASLLARQQSRLVNDLFVARATQVLSQGRGLGSGKPNTPPKVPPFLPEQKKPSSMTKEAKQQLIEAFSVLVKRGREFNIFASGLSRGEAFRLGQGALLQDLSATAKVVRENRLVEGRETSVRVDEELFRQFRIKKGQRVYEEGLLIQNKGKRLATQRERNLLQQARKSTTKKSRGGRSWL